ncbi:MAG: hypothetical protein ACO3MJ_02165 [Alphaproteobacteria bacterium]
MAKYFTFAPEAFKILETSAWKKQDASALIKTRWEWGVGGLTVPDEDPAFDLERVEKNENDEWRTWSDGFELEGAQTWIETEDAVLSEAFISHDIDGTATLKILGWREISTELSILGPIRLVEMKI